ncbi:MAG: hypothetical protein CL927_01320, partial [Deltaproteobacteria bacterium]|nr:hypothetical protein [Deltaproteobacteria bacterium]
FEVYMGSSTSGGDGIAFFIADPSTSTSYVSGTGDTFGGLGLDGYAVTFDTYQDTSDPTASSGSFIGLYELDSASGWTLLDSDVSLPTLEDDNTHNITITVEDGEFEITVDGTTYLTSTVSSYSMPEALVGWGGGTSSATAYQSVDDPFVGCAFVP